MDAEQKRLAFVIRHLKKFVWDNGKAQEVSYNLKSNHSFYSKKTCPNL